MVFKIFTTTRCGYCKKEIGYKDISEGRKYFCSGKHRDEYVRKIEIASKAMAKEGCGSKGCCN